MTRTGIPMKLSTPLLLSPSSHQGSTSSTNGVVLSPRILSFLNDFGKSAVLYVALLLIASKDNQVDLKEKFALQASGISHLLDTYSDGLIVVVMLAKLWWFRNVHKNISRADGLTPANISSSLSSWNNQMPTALQYSYKGVLCFGVVATIFHGLGVDESGEDPHPLFSCYFSMVGAFILYWHAKGLLDLSSLVSLSKDAEARSTTRSTTQQKQQQHQRIQAHFWGLGLLPLWICIAGASSAVTRFLFNGYGFFYAAFAMEPLLKQAAVAVTASSSSNLSSLRWKLQFLRILFPSIGVSYVVESLIVQHLQIDPHAIVHVLAMTYVLVMHSILSTLPSAAKHAHQQ